MTRRRGTASIVASPVLVGAVTTLVVVVSVFLAYNANQGLPFVPTYNLKAELPGGANLVKGNEIRVGGFRVGLVDKIRPKTVAKANGKRRSIALVEMKLDKKVEPLASDTKLVVRSRSALGLKYIEATPGRAKTTFVAGDTIPLKNSTHPVEFDDLLTTFDQGLRDDSRTALTGYGDALAGRGQSLNIALSQLPTFFGSLTAVMDLLNDSDTNLDEFFKQIGRASAQVAPVAKVQADLFENLADTFEAFSRNPDALRATIEGAPPTLDVAIRSFRVQRAFLAAFADLSRRLRPAAQELPRSLPTINAALVEGQPVLRRLVAFNQRTENVFRAIDDLAEDPNTLAALRDLNDTMTVTGPLLNYITPIQAVCNNATYFFTGLGEHISETVGGGVGGREVGTIERVLLKLDAGSEGGQDNRASVYDGDRPADVPASLDPQNEHLIPSALPEEERQPAVVTHGQPYQPAITRSGAADCQNGQNGYLDGPLTLPGGPYGPWSGDEDDLNDQVPDPGGGSHIVNAPNIPRFIAGPTFNPNAGADGDPATTNGLGVRRLRDVP